MIAPLWAKEYLADGRPNPDFVKEIGPWTVNGLFDDAKIKELNDKGLPFKRFVGII